MFHSYTQNGSGTHQPSVSDAYAYATSISWSLTSKLPITTQTNNCRWRTLQYTEVPSHGRSHLVSFVFILQDFYYMGHFGPPCRYELMEPPPLNASGVPETHSCRSSGVQFAAITSMLFLMLALISLRSPSHFFFVRNQASKESVRVSKITSRHIFTAKDKGGLTPHSPHPRKT
jgi:hypothetical protein